MTEQIIKGDIAIIKHTDDGGNPDRNPESGAEFQVFLKAAGSYETPRNPSAMFLSAMRMALHSRRSCPTAPISSRQTKGWEGRELMDDFEVYIAQDGQTYRYLINNANFESFIKVVKVDAGNAASPFPMRGPGSRFTARMAARWK